MVIPLTRALSLRNLVSGYECGRVFPAGVGPGSPSRDAASWLPSRFGLLVETRRQYFPGSIALQPRGCEHRPRVEFMALLFLLVYAFKENSQRDLSKTVLFGIGTLLVLEKSSLESQSRGCAKTPILTVFCFKILQINNKFITRPRTSPRLRYGDIA